MRKFVSLAILLLSLSASADPPTFEHLCYVEKVNRHTIYSEAVCLDDFVILLPALDSDPQGWNRFEGSVHRVEVGGSVIYVLQAEEFTEVELPPPWVDLHF